MLLHYKQRSEHFEAELLRARDILAFQQHEYHLLVQEGREVTARNVQLTHGAEIVVRALDSTYELSRRILANNPAGDEERDQLHRIMMRGDIGFAILQGAPFVDLTATEEIDPDETESESEEDLDL